MREEKAVAGSDLWAYPAWVDGKVDGSLPDQGPFLLFQISLSGPLPAGPPDRESGQKLWSGGPPPWHLYPRQRVRTVYGVGGRGGATRG